MSAGRRHPAEALDLAMTSTLLAKAREVAARTGTATGWAPRPGGPNVAMHAISASMQLGDAKAGLSMGAAAAIAEKFPWDRYHSVIDIGAAEGCVPAQLALGHPHLTGGGFDLPAAGPAFEDYVASHGLTSRLRFYPGNFFTDPMPPYLFRGRRATARRLRKSGGAGMALCPLQLSWPGGCCRRHRWCVNL